MALQSDLIQDRPTRKTLGRPLSWHPDVVLRRILRLSAFPPWARTVAKWIGIAVAWYGFIGSILSIASSARWVVDSVKTAYRFVAAEMPRLVFLLDWIHVALAFWRSIVEPVHDLLFGWVPIHVPIQFTDVLIIVTVLVGGQVRGWLDTRQERRFARAVSPHLTREGRIACLKRILASLLAFTEADKQSDQALAEPLKDTAEVELVAALDELTENADESRQSDDMIDHILSLPPDNFSDWMHYIADAKQIEVERRKVFFMRSGLFAATLAGAVVIDLIYTASK